MGLRETSKALPGSLTAKAWVQAAPLAGSQVERPSAAFAQILSSLSSCGTGAFSGVPQGFEFCCSKGRAGLDCVKNKMNQRWAKLSGEMIELRFYKTFQKDLFISFLFLIMVTRLDSSEFLKFVEQNETAINITTYTDQENNKLLRWEWNEGGQGEAHKGRLCKKGFEPLPTCYLSLQCQSQCEVKSEIGFCPDLFCEHYELIYWAPLISDQVVSVFGQNLQGIESSFKINDHIRAKLFLGVVDNVLMVRFLKELLQCSI